MKYKIVFLYIFTVLFFLYQPNTLFSEEEIQNSGSIKYKKDYSFLIYFPVVKTEKRRSYIASVITDLLNDNLSVQKMVYIPDAKPVEIEYPSPPLSQNKKPLEDPREYFLSLKAKEKPSLFALDFKKIYKYDFDPAPYFTFGADAPSFSDQSFHLIQQIEQSSSSNRFTLRVALFWGNYKVFHESKTFNDDSVADAINALSENIRKRLVGYHWGSLDIATNPDKVSVYLDKRYMGKTPLSIKYLPLSDYKISLEKKGFKPIVESIRLQKEKTLLINKELKELELLGEVEIISNPEGASVYLDAEYKGMTPLEIKNIEPGYHQVKISKANHGSASESFQITPENAKIKIKKKLENQTRTRGEESFISRIFSYENLTYQFLSVSTAFSVSGLYYLSKRDKTTEIMSSKLSTHDPDSYTSEDLSVIDEMSSEINNYDKLSKNSFIVSGAFLFITGYFFMRYIFDTKAYSSYTYAPLPDNKKREKQIQTSLNFSLNKIHSLESRFLISLRF
ncbi:MAG: PEGA domain-containing protein [Spirochaetia bacterium]|nr:PEGA domain-containing protein [Spirochaetia bacterium]